MLHHADFPVTATPLGLFVVFATCLAVFHLLLLKFWRLSKIGWKRVDYVWLAAATLGLFGAATEVRRLVAPNLLMAANSYATGVYDDVRRELRFLSGVAVCRTFVPSEFSPPNLQHVQNEFDQVCRFAKEAYPRLPNDPPPEIEFENLGERPRVTETMLLDMLSELDQVLARYTAARREVKRIADATTRSDAETGFAVLSPILLAAALALRITKVTGELRLERPNPPMETDAKGTCGSSPRR